MAYTYKVDKTVVKNQYSIKFSLVDVTQADVLLMDKFGNPLVDFGGSFTGPPAFTLATNQRNLRTGLPVSVTFDGNSIGDAEERIQVYDSEMRVKISDALTALRANSDSFTESVEIEV